MKADQMDGRRLRVTGISFEHMHMGDNLRMVREHPDCEIVGICDSDPGRMIDAQQSLEIEPSKSFTDWRRCIESTKPDWLILCPATGDHARWIERLAPYGLPILLEKPMADSLENAENMIEVCRAHGVVLAINWPLYWVPAHRTSKRLVDEGKIGRLNEVHYYDGNRGPLWHTADKREISAEEVASRKPTSWFYHKAAGGGSLLDYLGYGVTLGSWFFDGAQPLEVTSITDIPSGIEVDEHSITVVRYPQGLSKFETRWGTFTDPWIHQPQPKCGFVLVGSEGTISSYDYAATICMQDRNNPAGIEIPVDRLLFPNANPVQYFVHCLQNNLPIEGPLSPSISRLGQKIVDAAVHSASLKRSVLL